jgi:hypothetical protein
MSQPLVAAALEVAQTHRYQHVDYLRHHAFEKERGRTLVLVTASHRKFANDPVVFAVKDRISQLTWLIFGIVLFLGSWSLGNLRFTG